MPTWRAPLALMAAGTSAAMLVCRVAPVTVVGAFVVVPQAATRSTEQIGRASQRFIVALLSFRLSVCIIGSRLRLGESRFFGGFWGRRPIIEGRDRQANGSGGSWHGPGRLAGRPLARLRAAVRVRRAAGAKHWCPCLLPAHGEDHHWRRCGSFPGRDLRGWARAGAHPPVADPHPRRAVVPRAAGRGCPTGAGAEP